MNRPYVIWIFWASCEFLSSEKVHVWDSHGIANTFYFRGRRKSGYERRTKVCHSERSFTHFFVWDASFRMCSQLVTIPNHELLRPHERNFRVIEFYFDSRIVLSDFRFQQSYIYRTRLVCGWELNWSLVIKYKDSKRVLRDRHLLQFSSLPQNTRLSSPLFSMFRKLLSEKFCWHNSVGISYRPTQLTCPN
jgi:hypothetical protein